jgi:hypothetical protein
MKQKFPIGIPKHYAYEDVASLYLASALNFAVEAVLDICAAQLFAEILNNIEPPDEILSILLQEETISVDKILAMLDGSPNIEEAAEAWSESLSESRETPSLVMKSEILYSVDIAGHFVMLAVFIELILNATLETMVEQSELDSELWKGIERWDIVQKAIFAFRDEFKSGGIKIEGLKRLQSLRNKFVHYKSGHYGSHELTIGELFVIWNQVSDLLALTKKYLPDSGFDDAVNHLKSKFVQSE